MKPYLNRRQRKTGIAHAAPGEPLRREAVERVIASFGRFPDLVSNEELEEPEKRHLRRARAR
jgi:hypothetical protein